MQVIMIKNHANVGQIDDIVEVSDGFGENFLLSKGIAILATESNLKRLNERLLAAEEEMESSQKDSLSLSIEIKDLFLNIYRDGHNGKMFGSVTASDIVDELEKENIEITTKKIKVAKVNNFGSYSCIVDCGSGIKEELTFMVEEA